MGKKKTSSYSTPVPTIKALNKKQGELISAIDTKQMVVVTGSAGTGKTFISAAYAALFYKASKCDQIILCRPTVPISKSIGFLPGTLEEKMGPWCQPFVSVLEEFLGKGAVETMVKNGNLDVVPFEVLRGRSWNDCYVILDEAQNTTKEEMKAFVTRIGERCTVIINGDVTQSDINRHANGLAMVQAMIKSAPRALKSLCALVEFTEDDIVRSELCKLWVKEFNKLDK